MNVNRCKRREGNAKKRDVTLFQNPGTQIHIQVYNNDCSKNSNVELSELLDMCYWIFLSTDPFGIAKNISIK